MFAEPCYLVLTTGVQTKTSDIYLKTKSIDDNSDFIAIASVALIYNSFSISLTERTRQFGLFKSIGATRFQVMTSVFF